jgi:hypothetical protein
MEVGAPTYRYSDGALVVQAVANDQCKEVFTYINNLTIFQECASWLNEHLACGASQLRVCYLAGSRVIVGYIKFLHIREKPMEIEYLCALVPRMCVGVALMHAAVSECIHRYGVSEVVLSAVETAKPFYEGLRPNLIDGSRFLWSASDLLQTLTARSTTCSVPADSFWLRTYRVYVEKYLTRNRPINDPRLRIAAAMKDDGLRGIAIAIKTIRQHHKEFAKLLAEKLPEFRKRERETEEGYDDADIFTPKWTFTLPPSTLASTRPTFWGDQALHDCSRACFNGCPAPVRIGNAEGVRGVCSRTCEAYINGRQVGAALGGRGRDLSRGRSGSKNRRSSRKPKTKRRGSLRKTRTKRSRSSRKTRTKRRGSGSSRQTRRH